MTAVETVRAYEKRIKELIEEAEHFKKQLVKEAKQFVPRAKAGARSLVKLENDLEEVGVTTGQWPPSPDDVTADSLFESLTESFDTWTDELRDLLEEMPRLLEDADAADNEEEEEDDEDASDDEDDGGEEE